MLPNVISTDFLTLNIGVHFSASRRLAGHEQFTFPLIWTLRTESYVDPSNLHALLWLVSAYCLSNTLPQWHTNSFFSIPLQFFMCNVLPEFELNVSLPHLGHGTVGSVDLGPLQFLMCRVLPDADVKPPRPHLGHNSILFKYYDYNFMLAVNLFFQWEHHHIHLGF